LARAIIRRPALLLLDEPLSNLDARLRDAMRRELSTLIRKIGITALFVTHDQVEALSIADHVAVMDAGRIVQEGTPFEIYDRPKSLFVARFLGATNVLRGSVEASDSEGKALIVLDRGHRLLLCTDCEPGEPVDIALRPDCLALRTGAPDASLNSLQGSVASLSFQGGHIEYEVEVDGGARLRVHTGTQSPIGPGHAVYLSIDPARAMVFKRV
jgi:ABC-type Fe3+/spermidine/putrescine transport system ATPase subunit